MLVCISCGRVLISDGTKWTCPKKGEEYTHAPKNPPTELVDKRLTLNRV